MAPAALRGRLSWQVATVASVTRETPSVVTIGLEPPDWPDHRAGQHLDVRLTAEDGYTAEREYSIASAPGEPVAITVERLENGEVSPYLTEDLRAGDELELRGPIGGYFGRGARWCARGQDAGRGDDTVRQSPHPRRCHGGGSGDDPPGSARGSFRGREPAHHRPLAHSMTDSRQMKEKLL
jgi:Oxidoreductase FAD-binding domain